MRRMLALAVLVPVALLLSACGGGGGDGSDDAAQIGDVLTAGLTTEDPKSVCEGSLSTGLLKRIYGSAARCHTVESASSADSEPARTVDVSAVKVDGDRATAVVTLNGGDQDGATGQLSFVSQEEGWRVDEMSIAFLRSDFEAGMRNEPDLDAKTKTCLGEKVGALGDAELRDLAYGNIGERDAAQKQLVTLLAVCTEQAPAAANGDDSPSFLRKKFEEGVSQSLVADGASETAVACVTRELRKRITDKQIVDLVGKGGGEVPPELATAVAGALASCKAG